VCRLRLRRLGGRCARSAQAVLQLLRWCASRCGARRHVCCPRRWRLGCRCARSAQAAPASMLARVTVWRGAAHVPPQAVAAWPLLRSLDAGCASFYGGARHGVARGSTRAASGGGGLAVAALAQRRLLRLLRWCASRCGVRWHVCCLRRWRLGRRCAHSARAAPASTLARVTVWREAARVPSQASAAWPLLRSPDASCAGFYAGARHGVARGGTCAASGFGGLTVVALARRGLRRLLRCGARHGVARGGTCAGSSGGGLAVAALARRGLRWLPSWRASRCGARSHVCCLRQ